MLSPLLNEVFLTRTYAEWETRLRGENLMYGPILSPLDVIADPQALVNDFFVEVDQPDLGRIKTINSPTKFCEEPASIKSPTPRLGEQTEEILSELGYADEIPELREDKSFCRGRASSRRVADTEGAQMTENTRVLLGTGCSPRRSRATARSSPRTAGRAATTSSPGASPATTRSARSGTSRTSP